LVRAGGDRGGVADLIASIKGSKIPIICICNDKYKQSLKSLKNHCLEINWSKPTKQQISGRLRTIAQAEGLAVNQVKNASGSSIVFPVMTVGILVHCCVLALHQTRMQ
jgi:DNA polymerase III delta prime subunit